jgi:RimJ/RimL family protein N-acetyltransferase
MNNKRVVIMEWKKISLVVPEKQDTELWYRGINDIETQSYLWTRFWTIISRESEEEYYNSINKSDKSLTFSIYIKWDNKIIWNISLMKIDYKNSHTELWVAIFDKEDQNKWYWTEAIKLIQKYIFTVLGLNKIYLVCSSINNRAWKVYSKLWFIEIWRLKGHFYTWWEYHDDILMEIMKNEYLSKK